MILSQVSCILLFLWAAHVLERVFFCLYFWQLKEYRFDRIKGDFKKSIRVFVPKTSILMLALLFLYSWNDLVLVVFCVLGIYSFVLFIKRRWKLPKFTGKALILSILSLVTLLCAIFIFSNNFFLFIIIAEIAIPFVTFVIMELLQIPTFFIKKVIYKKAEDKIKKIKDLKGLTVIGVTGSYGKSSTKEFLYSILSKKYKVLKTSGNVNTEIGVAQTVINKLKSEHQIFIVEMGAYRKGEIKLLCKIVKPKIGVVTGVNEQHLALFGSMENLLLAEGGGELADCLPRRLPDGSQGILVVNGDNKYCLDLLKKSSNLPENHEKIYALSNKIIDSDIWADEISLHKDSVSFVATDRSGEMAHFNVKVLGRQNVQNLLGAILIAKELGMNFGEISEACKDIRPKQSGIVLKQGRHGIEIIDSSYSANPDGVLADLDYLSIFSGKKIIVMPSLIELGKKSGELHEKIGRKIAQTCDLAIITTKDYFVDIKKGAVDAGMQTKDILFAENPQDIFSLITLYAKSGDAVLLEGRVPSNLINLFA